MQNNQFQTLKKDIQTLNSQQQLELLLDLTSLIKSSENQRKSYTLLDLDGLGKEIWQKQDTDSYLKNLREEWQ